MNRYRLAVSVIACCCWAFAGMSAVAAELKFEDDFQADRADHWQGRTKTGEWAVQDGALRRIGSGDTLYRARLTLLVEDVTVETRFRLLGGSRETFGVALRVNGQSYLLVRYYDQPQALELLSYRDGSWTQVGSRSPKLSVKRDTWYRLKVVAVADRVMAKLWPDDADETNWQLNVPVANRSPGTFALVVHDDTRMEFDWARAKSTSEHMTRMLAEAQRQGRERNAEIAAKLKLSVVPAARATTSPHGPVRSVHLVPYVDNDRYPIAGRLTVEYGDERIAKDVTLEEFDLGEFRIELPEPVRPTDVRVTYETAAKTLQESFTLEPVEQLSYRDYVRTCLDALIARGRDHYGPVKSPLFMAVLDADLLVSPEKPLPLDALVRLEDRLHRRGERGSNLWYDQGLLRALYRMTQLTGNKQYATAADDYIRYFFDHCHKLTETGQVYLNGMPAWGTHVFWDCYGDRPGGDGDGNGPHEILVYDADWDDMLRVHPRGVQRTVEGIWQHHLVDQSTGLFNRHDDAQHGCDFAFSGGSFIKAFASMYAATHDPQQLHRAKTVAGWHWNNRNLETGLTPDCPGLKDRYDGNHTFTTIVGPHATALLKAYDLTKDTFFRDAAIGYIKGYDRYAWDDGQKTYWAMLKLDGTPVPEQPKGSGYDAYAPYGHVDVWRSTIYSYEFTLSAAQAAIQAYETTVRDGTPDPELLEIAKRWGQAVEAQMPPNAGRRWKLELERTMPRLRQTSGGYAEDYGRAISFFVHLYRATNDEHYLELAQTLANEAVDKLYHNGIFLGHPAKPYYETTNGVGLLLVALLELDDPKTDLGGAL